MQHGADHFSVPAHHRANWFAWLLGLAILVTLVSAVFHLSEELRLVSLLAEAQPLWVLMAVVLQLLTYVAQGQVWRMVVRAGGGRLPLGAAYRLSLAKLFIDQALPSGGLSGATLVSRRLEQLGVARRTVMAGLIVSLVSYYAAYLVCLAAALLIMTLEGHSSPVIFALAALFGGFAIAVIAAVLALAERRFPAFRGLQRLRIVQRGLRLVRQADPKIAHNPRLLAQAGLWQLLIVALDAASLWLLVRATGLQPPVFGVFAAFMTASLLRTIGFVPGGLGTFEAAAVLGLKSVGVPLPQALSATLLFRGLSFWLPMIPGMIFARLAASRGQAALGGTLLTSYWALERPALLTALQTSDQGLAVVEAQRRLQVMGPNELRERSHDTALQLLWHQLRSPLLILLVFAGGASALTGEWIDAAVVLVILFASVGIGYSRERRAASAAAALQQRVQSTALVLRDGQLTRLPHRELVPGDVVALSAGSLVPADGILLEATNFFVNEGLLTGESFPVEKKPSAVASASGLAQRTNCVFWGTNVRSGTARCLVVRTGAATELGSIARRLTLRPPQTEFDRGLLRFGYLVTTAMFVMVILVFALNVYLGRPALETLLFSIALAVGMSPELLPAILSVNLARGASAMAEQGVLVRQLNAIENLGSMSVLCTDKTGTLTEGVVGLEGAWDAQGQPCERVLHTAALNAALQAGLVNPLDEALLRTYRPDLSHVQKTGEVPYDFTRKRLSVIVQDAEGTRVITKGAFEPVLAVCSSLADGQPLDAQLRQQLAARFAEWSAQGTRVLAVAYRDWDAHIAVDRRCEAQLRFVGFLTFRDHIKDGAAEAITELRQLGVAVKLISGDNKLVCQHVARQVGLDPTRVMTGSQLSALHDEALWSVAGEVELFVEVDPNQKERIILALRKMGQVVGFLGDGINDAPAMHAADTSISVEQAADVAKAAADFVLLERHLAVIRRGIEEGRTTFANTLKYVLTTMSANLGNMVSMALASAFLPFLPLLAGQILLNNLLSDIPAVGLAGDAVDRELIERPRRWNMRFIGRFMIEFGLLSSLFDFLLFAVLLVGFAASAPLFRTAWFLESLLTELFIALVVRTRRPIFRSRPGRLLLISTLGVALLAVAIPYVPRAGLLGFTPLPLSVMASVLGITLLYVTATELAKAQLYRTAAD